MRPASHYCLIGCLTFTLHASAAVDYVRQIQPLWDEHCTDCHSANDADGDFALDTAAALKKGGKSGDAIVAGKADDSLLVKFLKGRSGKTGKNQFMPPGKRDHLKPEEIALIKQWINEGASTGEPGKTAEPLAGLPKVATKSPTKPIHSAAATTDGKLVALGRYGSVEIVDATAGKATRTITGIDGKVSSIVFSQDSGSLFVAAGVPGVSGVAYQFSVADGKQIRSFQGHTDALYTLALSPDGMTLATGGYDQKIRLWDISTGKEKAILKGHNGCINGLSFRPDGKVLASASADRTVKLWDATNGSRLDTFSQPTKEQFTVLFSKDGKSLLAGGADNRIRHWSISEKALEGSNPLLDTKFAHEGAVLGLALSPDGKSLISTAADKTLKLWDAATLNERTLLEKQPDWTNGIAWLGNNKIVAARQSGSSAVYTPSAPAKGEPLIKPVPKAAAAMPAAKPELASLLPRGFRIGQKSRITASGKRLTSVTGARASYPRIKVTVIESTPAVVLEVESPPDLPRGSYMLSLVNAAGESEKLSVLGDNLPQELSPPKTPVKIGTNFWGTLKNIGQQDDYPFDAKAGETIILDVTSKDLGSKAETVQLEVFDASGARLAFNRGLDSGTDPFIAFKAPTSGIYHARVSETTLDGSDAHFYRITIGLLPYVVGWWPLELPAAQTSALNLIGYNLPSATVQVMPGKIHLPHLRSRFPIQVPASTLAQAIETEPNDTVQTAVTIAVPGAVEGRLAQEGDVDCFAFNAKKGERWIIETRAAAYNAPTDTKVEVLDEKGAPVENLKLRAIRDSWNNFRGVDANNPDIRLEYWTEMDLDDYVYFNGDVMRIFRNPRGPDAGFLFYNNGGKRMGWFGTTPTSHALDEPAYVVKPLMAGETPVPNGLPVFSVPFTNDDDSDRKLGRDSRLPFTAPADGRYMIRVTDSRNWGGDRFAYRVTVRKPEPDFAVSLLGTNGTTVGAGGSMGFSLRAERMDGFDGAVTATIEGLPPGWYASTPVVIQAGHQLATGSLHADASAAKDADFSKVRITTTAVINGKSVTKTVSTFGKPVLGPLPKFVPHLEPSVGDKPVTRTTSQPLEIVLAPGQSTPAFIRVDRNQDKGLLNFDVHNLPFGVIVDNIGLNGVQVREGENVREIFLSAAKWVPEQDRLIHAAVASTRNEQASDGLITSYPVLLKIRKAKEVVQK